MNNQWVQIIGTLLIGGGLLNWIIPLYLSMFCMCVKSKEINEACFVLGGKIHRKWFFLNNLIFLAAFVVLTLLAFIFKNWVMFIILLPYFFAIFLLYWGNVYKRINAISDNHKVASSFTAILCLFCLFSHWIYIKFANIERVSHIVLTLIWLIIFVIPSKNKSEKDEF